MTCSYEVSPQLVIVHIDPPAWDAFAHGNEAPHLAANRVLGTGLLSHITDLPTQAIYKTLIERVLARGVSARFPFRCDAPDRRRYMEMRVELVAAARCRFVSSVLREEPRQAIPLLDPHTPHSESTLLSMCSWCKKVAVGGERWLEVEAALAALAPFNAEFPPGITHGICPHCEADQLHLLDSL